MLAFFTFTSLSLRLTEHYQKLLIENQPIICRTSFL